MPRGASSKGGRVTCTRHWQEACAAEPNHKFGALKRACVCQRRAAWPPGLQRAVGTRRAREERILTALQAMLATEMVDSSDDGGSEPEGAWRPVTRRGRSRSGRRKAQAEQGAVAAPTAPAAPPWEGAGCAVRAASALAKCKRVFQTTVTCKRVLPDKRTERSVAASAPASSCPLDAVQA